MPVMTPNSDFNAKLVNVRVMMMRFLSLPVQVAFENDATATLFLPFAEMFHPKGTIDRKSDNSMTDYAKTVGWLAGRVAEDARPLSKRNKLRQVWTGIPSSCGGGP